VHADLCRTRYAELSKTIFIQIYVYLRWCTCACRPSLYQVCRVAQNYMFIYMYVYLRWCTCACRPSPYQVCRVGQKPIYTVYIRYDWQGNHQIYGTYTVHIFTVLASPTGMLTYFIKFSRHVWDSSPEKVW